MIGSWARSLRIAAALVAASAALAGAPATASTGAGSAGHHGARPVIKAISPSHGSSGGGQAVTVRGRHFSHVKAVRFGSMAGHHLRVSSAHRLKVDAPKHAAGKVDVRVVTTSGTSATSRHDRFTYTQRLAVKSVAPASSATAGGTRVTIKGTGFSHVKSVAFGSAAGTKVSVASAHTLKVTAPAHTPGTVDVRIRTKQGHSAKSTADRFAFWDELPLPLPTPLATNQTSNAAEIVCDAPGTCRIVGSYFVDPTNQIAFIDTLSGPSVTAAAAPVPAGQSNLASSLAEISCPAAGTCVAAGYFTDTSNHTLGLIDTLSHGSWSSRAAPLPSDAGTDPTNYMTHIDCPTVSSCVALGTYMDQSGHREAVIDRLSGGSWTSTTAPLPAGAATDPNTHLSGVDCTAVGSCVVTGYYHDSSAAVQGLFETLASGSWTALKAPVPGGAGANPNAFIGAPSCFPGGACVVIGVYDTTSAHTLGLIETLVSGTWTATTAPLPADAGTNPGAELDDIACAAGSCTAVGDYADTSGHYQGVIDTLDGGTWTAQRAPLPADAAADPEAVYDRVVCLGVGHCVSTGLYQNAAGRQGMLDKSVGGTWSARRAPLPADAVAGDVGLAGLACDSAGFCAAAGRYSVADGSVPPLLVRAN